MARSLRPTSAGGGGDMTVNKERLQRAILALHDHGTRDGATATIVKEVMLKEGFTLEEIAAAAAAMKQSN